MVLGLFSLFGHHKGKVRLLTPTTKFTSILAVGLCSILYLTWYIPSISVKTELQRLIPIRPPRTEVGGYWDASPRRVIVFGDSWSDNGQYLVDPPSKDLTPIREEAQGKVWTEWLCSAVPIPPCMEESS